METQSTQENIESVQTKKNNPNFFIRPISSSSYVTSILISVFIGVPVTIGSPFVFNSESFLYISMFIFFWLLPVMFTIKRMRATGNSLWLILIYFIPFVLIVFQAIYISVVDVYNKLLFSMIPILSLVFPIILTIYLMIKRDKVVEIES